MACASGGWGVVAVVTFSVAPVALLALQAAAWARVNPEESKPGLYGFTRRAAPSSISLGGQHTILDDVATQSQGQGRVACLTFSGFSFSFPPGLFARFKEPSRVN